VREGGEVKLIKVHVNPPVDVREYEAELFTRVLTLTVTEEQALVLAQKLIDAVNAESDRLLVIYEP
jgi:hypothetical protein